MSDQPSNQAAEHKHSTASLAIRGSVWIVMGLVVSQFMRLVSNVALSKLLEPEAFGLMSLLGVVIAGMQMMSDIGIGPSIIQHSKGDDGSFLRTAWTVQIIRGIVISAIAAAISIPVGWAYDERLTSILPFAALTAAIGGFASTALYTLNRKLAMGKLTILDLGSQATGIVVMVAWALVHPSVWALVAGGLAGSFVRTVGSHLLDGHRRDRFGMDRAALSMMAHFGGWVFVSTLLTFFAGQSDRLIFGKLIPMEMLGVYSVAMNLSSMPLQLIARLGDSIAFPALSKVIRAGGALGPAVNRIRAPLCVAGVASAAAVGVAGPALIELLYDTRYADGRWIVRFLAVAGVFQVLECLSGSVLMAQGRVKWVAAGNAAKVVGIVTLVPLGFYYWEFMGALTGWVAAEGVKYAVCAWGARTEGSALLRRDAMLIVWGACVAGAAWSLERAWPHHSRFELVARTAVQCAIIGVGFAPLLWSFLHELKANALKALGKRRAPIESGEGSVA